MSAAPPSACTVGLQTDGPVSIVTLQRPERLNAINADLLRDLNAQLQTAQADAATRAIVLTGAGRAFCAGDDLKAFDDQSATPASMAQMCEDVQRITRTLMGGPKLVVGAVHGYAVGAGFEWLLNCDLRPHTQDGGQRTRRQTLIERQKVGARIAAHQQQPGAGHLGARARLRQPAPLAPAQQPEKHQRHAKAQRQQDEGRGVVEPPAGKNGAAAPKQHEPRRRPCIHENSPVEENTRSRPPLWCGGRESEVAALGRARRATVGQQAGRRQVMQGHAHMIRRRRPYRYACAMPNAAPPRALFHLAYNVTDLDTARRFYGGVLGCREGRSTDTWVDFDFFGHQISLHLGEPFKTAPTGHVGDHLVPMPHLGLILQRADWQAMAERLQAAGTDFVIAPQLRFAGQPGEQWTMFFCDPFGNPIEIKGFEDLASVYAA